MSEVNVACLSGDRGRKCQTCEEVDSHPAEDAFIVALHYLHAVFIRLEGVLQKQLVHLVTNVIRMQINEEICNLR